MRLFITGSGGVLGRQFCPIARAAGHDLETPGRAELDLFDAAAVTAAARAFLAALTLGSGIYNVCRDGEPVSNHKFRQATGWQPLS